MSKFFSYSRDFGFNLHESMEDAKREAEYYIGEALHESWDTDEVDSICYGEVKSFSMQCNVRPAPEGSECDYYCDYKLD